MGSPSPEYSELLDCFLSGQIEESDLIERMRLDPAFCAFVKEKRENSSANEVA